MSIHCPLNTQKFAFSRIPEEMCLLRILPQASHLSHTTRNVSLS